MEIMIGHTPPSDAQKQLLQTLGIEVVEEKTTHHIAGPTRQGRTYYKLVSNSENLRSVRTRPAGVRSKDVIFYLDSIVASVTVQENRWNNTASLQPQNLGTSPYNYELSIDANTIQEALAKDPATVNWQQYNALEQQANSENKQSFFNFISGISLRAFMNERDASISTEESTRALENILQILNQKCDDAIAEKATWDYAENNQQIRITRPMGIDQYDKKNPTNYLTSLDLFVINTEGQLACDDIKLRSGDKTLFNNAVQNCKQRLAAAPYKSNTLLSQAENLTGNCVSKFTFTNNRNNNNTSQQQPPANQQSKRLG